MAKKTDPSKMVPLKKGNYLVIETDDKTAFVVCGHLCAKRIEKTAGMTAQEATRLALKS